MPGDVTDLLEGVDAPNMHVDVAAVLGGGKRLRRRQRLTRSGATLAGAAVIVLGVVVVWSTGPAPVAPAARTPVTSISPTTVATSMADVETRVTLDVGHCWVEYVEFDGALWGIPFEKQFGWGGRLPKNWKGTGVMKRLADDRARYTDDGGKVLDMLPASGPSVYEVEGKGCA